MDTQKNLFIVFGEWLQERQQRRFERVTEKTPSRRLGRWLPSPGSVVFTLCMIALLLWAQTAGALPLPGYLNALDAPSTGTIAYQGRLADANGNPLTSTVNMEFRLYNAATGGTPLWSELWMGSNAVQVSDGLFNVMLGSLEPIPQNILTGNSSLWLGITAGTDDEMMPRVQLGSVPFAVQALTVPDGSVTTEKIADGAVQTAKLDVDDDLRMEGNLIVDGKEMSQSLDFWGKWSLVGVKPRFSDGSFGHNFAGGFGTTVQWDSDYAFFGLWDKGVDKKDAVISWGDNPADKLLFLYGQARDLNPREVMSLDSSGNLWVQGELRASGAKPAIVQTATFGQRKLYAAESPEVRFFDEGLARLADGIFQVTLDPIFLETIDGQFLVHVTPYGDASLYVDEIGEDYFVVRATSGDPDVDFAWRLSATRKGYAGVRLEQVDPSAGEAMTIAQE